MGNQNFQEALGTEADDEMSVSDAWSIVRTEFRRLALGTTAVMSIGIAIILVVPPKYEASALIQMGRVGQMEQAAQPLVVESTTLASVRMKSETFQSAARERAFLLGGKEANLEISIKDVAIFVTPTTDLVELRVHASSLEKARLLVGAMVEELRVQQLAEASIAEQQFDKLLHLKKTERERLEDALDPVAGENTSSGARRGAEAIPKSVRDTNSVHRLNLQTRLSQVDQEIAGIERVKNISTMWPARILVWGAASGEPVFPNKSKLILQSGIVGLMISVVWIFLRRSFVSRKKPGG